MVTNANQAQFARLGRLRLDAKNLLAQVREILPPECAEMLCGELVPAIESLEAHVSECQENLEATTEHTP